MTEHYNSLLLQSAYNNAAAFHEGQVRKFSGEPYVQHCVRVAQAVERAGGEPWVVAAALLHDTIEDTEATASMLLRNFDPGIVDLVVLLSHEKDEEYNDYVRRVAADPNGWLIKRADILDNMSTLPKGHPLLSKYAAALWILAGA